MQTTNFIKKAMPNLKGTQKFYGENGCHKVARLMYYMQEWLQKTPKFMLPEDGAYYDNKTDYDQVDADLLRLPFPIMSVEYRIKVKTGEKPFTGGGLSTKRIDLLVEVDCEDEERFNSLKNTLFTSLLGTEHIKKSGFILFNISYMDDYDLWEVKPYAAFIEYGQKLLEYQDEVSKKKYSAFSSNGLLMNIENEEILRPILEQCDRFGGIVNAFKMDLLDELTHITQLCSMLNCSNVEIEKISSRRKPKTKKGCLPFDEYHVLKIADRNNSATPEKQSESADKRSYRTHLRRGHIRRIASGYTWVSSCVVNPHQSNTVYKDYLI